jgi:ABC-type multidrug transport system fused ATPase/permease subunit
MTTKSSNPILTMIKAEWQNLGKNKKRYILTIILFMIAGLIGLISPWLIGQIFNSIQNGQITTLEEVKNLSIAISLLIVLNIAFWIFHGTARVIEQFSGFQTHKNYSNKKIRKTLELPVKWHKDNHTGDTINRINKSRQSLASYSQHDVFDLIYILIDIFGSLGIMFFINVNIGFFALIFCLIIMYMSMKLDNKIKKIHKKINEFDHMLSASIFDYFSNIITIITLRLKKTVRKKIDEKLELPRSDFKRSVFLIELKWALSSMFIKIMTVAALIYQAYTDFYTTRIILIGTLFMLYSYLDRVGKAFFRFAQFYGRMTKKAADIESAEPIDEAFSKIQKQLKSTLPKNWKQINIKNLSFTYNQEGNIQHLDNISFNFKRGEKIALIGESGSGKSTILSLLRGLYLPQSAKITCDLHPLKHGIQTLKQSVTLIPQDPEIFNETISYNIAMGMFSKKKDIEKAIRLAQFKTVIDRLPKGIETSVQEKGVSLSGGEKQRLALARGILSAKDSDIVLLDEPTSSVDSINERKIHDNIFKEFKDKTIISSIHRLHLLDKFDRIVIFDKGKIIAQGTYKEIKENKIFRRIWKKYLGSKKK